MRRLQLPMIVLALLLFVSWANAAQPNPMDQKLADRLVNVYRASRVLQDYDVDIQVNRGVVTLSGVVGDERQWATLVTLTTRHPGVKNIVENVRVLGNNLRPIVARTELQAPRKFASPVRRSQPISTRRTSASTPVPSAAQVERIPEPKPMTSYVGGIAPYSDTPVMPPHSWPAYTPYNNYASMAYQTQYPSGAWPFIGPPHPYPMIPSGWRRVELKWKRGYWWMKFRAH